MLPFPPSASTGFAFSFLMNGHFVSNRAAHRRAGQGVMVREMTGDPADDRAA